MSFMIFFLFFFSGCDFVVDVDNVQRRKLVLFCLFVLFCCLFVAAVVVVLGG